MQDRETETDVHTDRQTETDTEKETENTYMCICMCAKSQCIVCACTQPEFYRPKEIVMGKRLHKVSHLPTDLVREMRLHKVSRLSPSDETLNRGLPCAHARKKITHAHPCRSSVDYGNNKIIQRAPKMSVFIMLKLNAKPKKTKKPT